MEKVLMWIEKDLAKEIEKTYKQEYWEKVKDFQCLTDKYETMNYEKWDCLGKTMKLKDLFDLYWNYVYIFTDDNERIGGGYKDTDGLYSISFDGNEFYDNADNLDILNKMVFVSSDFDYDDDDNPVIDCKLVNTKWNVGE